MLRLYQRSGAEWLLRRSGFLKVLGLGQIERLAPRVTEVPFRSEIGKTFPALGSRRARVAFVAGCMQTVFMADLNRATIRVLQRSGCEIVIPAEQTCCGALQVHAGMRELARTLARRNIHAFNEVGPIDAIVTNTAGCGSVLKEYGDLLAADESCRDAALGFAARVKDVTEFLAELGLQSTNQLKPLPATVTYQDPCHLAHAQKIRSAPRDLLRAIPGVRLIEMARADQCCGSAGIYNIVQPDIAARVLEEKMDTVEATGAAVIATANPGCILQLRAGVANRRTHQRVAHVIELLDEAYGGAGDMPSQ
jgi:glycolate oxidase iron-sulfur subunit